MASQGGRVTGLHGVSLSLGVGPTRIYGGGDGHEEPWAPRRLGVGERRDRRDEDGRRGGGRAVRAVALVVQSFRQPLAPPTRRKQSISLNKSDAFGASLISLSSMTVVFLKTLQAYC